MSVIGRIVYPRIQKQARKQDITCLVRSAAKINFLHVVKAGCYDQQQVGYPVDGIFFTVLGTSIMPNLPAPVIHNIIFP